MEDLFGRIFEMAGGVEATRAPGDIAARLVAALVAGFSLAIIYQRTHTGVVFMAAIPHTLVMLSGGGCLIWLVVGDNIVRAFGLGGMIGLIRYRTRISDPKDTTVLLFSMITGMACGLGQYAVAAMGVGFVGLTLSLLKIFDWGAADDETAIPLSKLKDHLDDDGPHDKPAKRKNR